MTRKSHMGEEFGRSISGRGKMQVQRPWGRYELPMLEKHRGNLYGGWSLLGSRRKTLILLNFIGHSEHSGYYSKSVGFHRRVYVWD